MYLLDDEQLYRALVARDARFDSVFFVGVLSTRVYCRPICPAPNPRPERCRYYASAAAAERRGFRPCLRCRPELAPGDPTASGLGIAGDVASVDAVRTLARTASARIASGALDRASLDDLAADLGVTARHLRRAVERELGASPVELAQTRRLLMAKQLLGETGLSVTRVAMASGFGSVRRFNALCRAHYRLAPSDLRRSARSRSRRKSSAVPDATPGETVSVSLGLRPPFDWNGMLDYFAMRATPGVEAVTHDDGGQYWRSVQLHGHAGYVVASQAKGTRGTSRHNMLQLEISTSLLPVLIPLLSRMRRLFDLDAHPQAVAEHFTSDPTLAPLVVRRPGLRVPGALDGFEVALRTVLGQQVSVRGASTLAGRLARLVAEPLLDAAEPNAGTFPLTHLPVNAGRLADASLSAISGIGLPRARAECIAALARAVAGGELPELAADSPTGDPSAFTRRFTELPGIGAWTASYVAMRALRWPDAFPDGDLALRKAMGGLSPSRLRRAAERWRPWRAYAAQHLWTSLGDTANGIAS